MAIEIVAIIEQVQRIGNTKSIDQPLKPVAISHTKAIIITNTACHIMLFGIFLYFLAIMTKSVQKLPIPAITNIDHQPFAGNIRLTATLIKAAHTETKAAQIVTF